MFWHCALLHCGASRVLWVRDQCEHTLEVRANITLQLGTWWGEWNQHNWVFQPGRPKGRTAVWDRLRFALFSPRTIPSLGAETANSSQEYRVIKKIQAWWIRHFFDNFSWPSVGNESAKYSNTITFGTTLSNDSTWKYPHSLYIKNALLSV